MESLESTLLNHLDRILKQHWSLGKNILLCWTHDEEGIQVLVAPHFFLGHFSASLTDCAPVDRLDALNGSFIRQLISGSRYLSPREFEGAATRLELIPLQIELPVKLTLNEVLIQAVDGLIQRYSINYVKSRAVLLLDIVNFSLVSPFEQSSQLNSLSYSLNSAHKKLREQNIAIDFSRTTTGDGFYVWHQDTSPKANLELFQFMLLVLADNAAAHKADHAERSGGQIVPKIRTGFHIGSHFEFYQVEGLKPGMNSFIVGDVTIELARMLDIAEPGQIIIGDFETKVPTSDRESAYMVAADTEKFIDRANRQLSSLRRLKLLDKQIKAVHCFLSGIDGPAVGNSTKHFLVTDKHGRSRNAYNLRVNFRLDDHSEAIIMGLQGSHLTKRATATSKAPLSLVKASRFSRRFSVANKRVRRLPEKN